MSNPAQKLLITYLGLLDNPAATLSVARVEALLAMSANYGYHWDPLTTTDDNGATAVHHTAGVAAATRGRESDCEDDNDDETAAADNNILSVLDYLHEKHLEAQKQKDETERIPFAALADADGETVFHYAARGGRVAVVEHLLTKLMDVSPPASSTAAACALITAPDSANEATPLHYAARGGHSDVLRLMMELLQEEGRKEEENAKGNDGRESLLKTALYQRDASGMLALHYAASGGSLRAFADILSRMVVGGARRDAEGGDVAGPSATKKQKNGAGADDENTESHDPLAASFTTKILSLADNDGTTVLHYAAEGGNLRLVKALVEGGVLAGGDTGEEDDGEDRVARLAIPPVFPTPSAVVDTLNQTPLHFAVMGLGSGDDEEDDEENQKEEKKNAGALSSPLLPPLVAYLLGPKCNINPNAQTAESKMTCLHYAAMNGNERLMAALVGNSNAASQCDGALVNEEGMTAADILAERLAEEAAGEDEEDGGCCGGADDHGHGHSHGDGCCGAAH